MKNFRLISSFIFLALLSALFYPTIHKSTWIGNTDIHALLEFSSSLVAITAGIMVLLHFLTTGRYFFLFTSIAFIQVSGEEVIHGLFSFNRIWSEIPPDQIWRISTTWLTGRFIFLVCFILAYLTEKKIIPRKKRILTATLFNIGVFICSASLASLLFHATHLSSIVRLGSLTKQIIELSIASMFFIIFILDYRMYSRQESRSPLLLSITLCAFGQVLLHIFVFDSAKPYDSHFDTAHVIKLLSYFVPIFGVWGETVKIHKVAERRMKQIEREMTRRVKTEIELAKHKNQLEDLVRERTLILEQTIEKLKETQSQLVQSEKLASLGILTAGIAHEINNPVNYINSSIVSLEMLATELIDILKIYETITQENIHQKLEEIKALKESVNLSETIEGVTVLSDNIKIGAKKTADIVKSLQLFSRTDSDKPILSDVNESVDSTLILLHNQYAGKIDIIKEYGKLPPVTCFPGKLNQVFMNLLANAIQAIEGNGKIHIKTMHRPQGSPNFKKGCVSISIRDSGSGIPFEIRNKIFEPFFTTKDIGKGTGLGLAISYGIIEQHRGKIEFTSDVNKGTEFNIYLPV